MTPATTARFANIARSSLLALTMAVVGCASAPPPKEQMALARSAVDKAERAGAAQRAPVELQKAQSKLSAATAAMAHEDNEQALRLAEEAEVDARLAEARARSAQAQAAAAQVQQGVQVLRRELQRETQ